MIIKLLIKLFNRWSQIREKNHIKMRPHPIIKKKKKKNRKF